MPTDAIDISGDGGICKRILHAGDPSSGVPFSGAEVHIHYVGTLLSDGTQFDSSRERPGDLFVLGKGRVLPGLEQGVATMLVGERAELFCRDDYAYGEDGVEDTIPPGASLKFDLKLLEWGLTSEDKLRRTTMTVADKLAEVRKMKLEVCG